MRQSVKFMQVSCIAILAAVAVTGFGISDVMAQDFGTLAKTTLKTQTGGAANLIKQGSVLLAAAFGVGGIGKLYANAKDGFKEGAKGFVVPGIMVAASGLMLGMNTLSNVIVRQSTGTQAETQLDNTKGGDITW